MSLVYIGTNVIWVWNEGVIMYKILLPGGNAFLLPWNDTSCNLGTQAVPQN